MGDRTSLGFFGVRFGDGTSLFFLWVRPGDRTSLKWFGASFFFVKRFLAREVLFLISLFFGGMQGLEILVRT